jgi:hypothetical protein
MIKEKNIKEKNTETSGSISHAYLGNNVVRGIPSTGGMPYGNAHVLQPQDLRSTICFNV